MLYQINNMEMYFQGHHTSLQVFFEADPQDNEFRLFWTMKCAISFAALNKE